MIYAKDQAPKAIEFAFAVDAPASISTVVAQILRPNGTVASWPLDITDTTADAVVCRRLLEAGDVPVPGIYTFRLFGQDAEFGIIADSTEGTFSVAPTSHPWPQPQQD